MSKTVKKNHKEPEAIRIEKPPEKLLKSVIFIALKNKRTVPKQAELMLEEYIKEHPELLKK